MAGNGSVYFATHLNPFETDDQQTSSLNPITNDYTLDVFSSVQTAVNDPNAVENDLIKITAAHFHEDILYDRDLILILSGGYYCSYSDNPLKSAINSLIIRNGTVLLEKITIKSDP